MIGLLTFQDQGRDVYSEVHECENSEVSQRCGDQIVECQDETCILPVYQSLYIA